MQSHSPRRREKNLIRPAPTASPSIATTTTQRTEDGRPPKTATMTGNKCTEEEAYNGPPPAYL